MTTQGIPEAPTAPTQTFDPASGGTGDAGGVVLDAPLAVVPYVPPQPPEGQPPAESPEVAALRQQAARAAEYEQRIAEYEQRIAETNRQAAQEAALRQQQEAAQQVEQEIAQYRQYYETQGYAYDQLRPLLDNYRAARTRQIEITNAANQFATFVTRKANAAVKLAAQHGVSAEELMKYDDTASMERAARDLSRVSALEKEITALKQAKVPAQLFDNNRAGAPAAHSRQARLAVLNAKSVLTDVELTEMGKLLRG